MFRGLFGQGTGRPNNNNNNDGFPIKYTGRSYNNMMRDARKRAYDARERNPRHVPGVDRVTEVKSLLFLTPEERRQRNFLTPEQRAALNERERQPPRSDEESQWREWVKLQRRANGILRNDRLRRRFGLLPLRGGYTRKRKAKKSKSTRRR